MDTTVGLIVAAVVALGLGILFDRWLLTRSNRGELARARLEAQRLVEAAEQEARLFRAEHIEQVEVGLARKKQELELEATETKRNLGRLKQKLDQRHAKLSRRAQLTTEREELARKASEAIEALRSEATRGQRETEQLRTRAHALLEDADARQEQVAKREEQAAALETQWAEKNERLTQMVEEQIRKLEQVSGLTQREAREMLLGQLTDEARLEASSMVKEIRDEAKLKAGREARKIIITAI
ncbi:MAG: Rnase Y domain-containing protein, partial [Rhodothermales bacterium]